MVGMRRPKEKKVEMKEAASFSQLVEPEAVAEQLSHVPELESALVLFAAITGLHKPSSHEWRQASPSAMLTQVCCIHQSPLFAHVCAHHSSLHPF